MSTMKYFIQYAICMVILSSFIPFIVTSIIKPIKIKFKPSSNTQFFLSLSVVVVCLFGATKISNWTASYLEERREESDREKKESDKETSNITVKYGQNSLVDHCLVGEL